MNALPVGLWSEQQQEWLRALGHEVWQLGSSSDATPIPPPEPIAASPRTEPAVTRQHAAVTASNAKGPSTDNPLLRALARAAGRSTQDDEFLAVLPELSSLHRSAAARRALWPRLRALRKRSGG